MHLSDVWSAGILRLLSVLDSPLFPYWINGSFKVVYVSLAKIKTREVFKRNNKNNEVDFIGFEQSSIFYFLDSFFLLKFKWKSILLLFWQNTHKPVKNNWFNLIEPVNICDLIFCLNTSHLGNLKKYNFA